MARNGSGGYTRVSGTPYVNGTIISETIVNNEMADLGNEIANSIAKDGQTVITANLPMGGYRHTGVGNSSARTHYAATGQVQDNVFCTGTVGGSANAITLTLAPVITAYVKGQRFEFVSTAANTGATTLNVNGVGAKNVYSDASTALVAGDIPNGRAVIVIYDGTQFQIVNYDPTITTIPSGATATTQSVGDSSTKVATTAFVNAEIANDLLAYPASDAESLDGSVTNKFTTPGRLSRHKTIPKAIFEASSTAITTDMAGNITFVSCTQDTGANTVTLRVDLVGLPNLSTSNFICDARLPKIGGYFIATNASRVDNDTLDIIFTYYDNGLDANLSTWFKPLVTLYINT
jgi:hypothetical protein